MSGNAHAWRRRNGYGKTACLSGCIYCKSRPSEGKYSNKTGHRKNPARKRKGRRKKTANVV